MFGAKQWRENLKAHGVRWPADSNGAVAAAVLASVVICVSGCVEDDNASPAPAPSVWSASDVAGISTGSTATTTTTLPVSDPLSNVLIGPALNEPTTDEAPKPVVATASFDTTASVRRPANQTPLAMLPVKHSELAAKPIVGGTLLVTADDRYAVLADPDRDAVFIVELETATLSATVELEQGDEPGRLIELPEGKVGVALRRGGAIAIVELETATLEARYATCAAPRGLDYDAEREALVVACLGGSVERLELNGGARVWQRQLSADLRDVNVVGSRYYVSRLKDAELVMVEAEGDAPPATSKPALLSLEAIPTRDEDGYLVNSPGVHQARVLRRTQQVSGSRLVLLHQRANRGRLTRVYYGSVITGSGGVVHTAVTTFDAVSGEFTALGALPPGQYYDLALSKEAERLAAFYLTLDSSVIIEAAWSDIAGLGAFTLGEWKTTDIGGQASALAYTAGGDLLIQLREPPALQIFDGARVELASDSRFDTGHAIFHASTQRGVACTSCHPEGGDDGITWEFTQVGARQTQSLLGGLLSTLPLHWEGERETMVELMNDTYVTRMGGGSPDPAQTVSMGLWLDTLLIPTASAPSAEAMASGRLIFEAVGCATCHAGATYTDNLNHDVGTGLAYQTPTLLGLRHSAPYMHDGCADSLEQRFDDVCGGAAHGSLSELTSDEQAQLAVFLMAL